MPRRQPPAKGPDWPPAKALPLLKEQLRRLQEFKGKSFREVKQVEDEWEQFTRSVLIHAFGENSANVSNHYMARSAGVHNLRGISDQQKQLNFQQRISQYEATLNSSIRELEASLPMPEQHPVPVFLEASPRAATRTPNGDEPLILISHSSKDLGLATTLVEFLKAGLLVNRIRCSSVDGYRLPAGVQTEGQLRAEVNSTEVLIGLITPNSLASAYVMFELGARWGAGSFMVPLLAGVSASEIRGPLSGLNALRADNDSQLHQLLADVAKVLGRDVERPASYVGQLSALKAQASQTSTSNVSVQLASKPSDDRPLVAPIVPVARANLRIEGIKITKELYLQEDTWTLTPNPPAPTRSFKGLLADVANVPTASGSIKAVNVRASLMIGSRNYSPLPWLDESTNAVKLEPAARKTILLAVADDQVMGLWNFVLNHREHGEGPGAPSKMDWTNVAPYPSQPMEILLVDVDSGELIATFKYLWRIDENLGYPYLSDVPED